MSTATARLYRMRGSLSTGEYPLFSSGQDLSGYLKATYTVKYAKGLQTRIDVPTFTGYEDVNIVELDGSYYFVVAWQESTTYNGSVTYMLEYMAPTSLLRSASSVTMYLERSPTYLCDYLTDDWTRGLVAFDENNALDVGNDAAFQDGDSMYWVQITGVDNNSDIRRFGFFAKVTNDGDFADPDVYTSIRSPNGFYPSIADAINNIGEIVPFSGSAVKDVSISRRCPYDYMFVQSTSPPNPWTVAIKSSNDTAVNPSQNGSSTLLTYDVDDLIRNNTPKSSLKTITFTPTDAMKLSGNYIIRDWNKNSIATFPIAEGSTFYSQTFGDVSGLYTIITNGYRTMTIPEGKLPWSTSTWDDYKAYQMAGDRQALSNAMSYANQEREMQRYAAAGEAITSAISGAMVGAFTMAGNPAGAGVGLITGGITAITSGYQNQISYELNMARLQDDQILTETRARLGMGSGYNTPYGLIYVTLTIEDANLVIGYDVPLNDAATLLTAYVDRVGYPCEGSHTVSIQNGYYKGYIPAGSTSNNGMYFDDLNRRLRQGFKFVSP